MPTSLRKRATLLKTLGARPADRLKISSDTEWTLPTAPGRERPAATELGEPMGSLHLDTTASLALRAALEAQGTPTTTCSLEAQVAALELMLREAPGAREATEGHSTQGPTLRELHPNLVQ